jgi:hypothetical protein
VRFLVERGRLAQRSQTGPPDIYGTPTWVTTYADVHCLMQPRSSEELLVEGMTKWAAFFPAGTEVGAVDGVLMDDGRWFEVHGPARPHLNPRTGLVSHVEADAELSDRPAWAEESS